MVLNIRGKVGPPVRVSVMRRFAVLSAGGITAVAVLSRLLPMMRIEPWLHVTTGLLVIILALLLGWANIVLCDLVWYTSMTIWAVQTNLATVRSITAAGYATTAGFALAGTVTAVWVNVPGWVVVVLSVAAIGAFVILGSTYMCRRCGISVQRATAIGSTYAVVPLSIGLVVLLVR